jgi:L-cysteine desulfidase
MENTMINWHYHHIIPKHHKGTDDKDNLLKVNVALHALLHKILYEEEGRWQDKLAWQGLSGQIGKDEVTIIARQNSRRNLGGKMSDELKDKISAAASKPKSQSHRNKISKANSGSNNSNAKLDERDVHLIKYNFINQGMSDTEIANLFNVTRTAILKIRKNQRWKEM